MFRAIWHMLQTLLAMLIPCLVTHTWTTRVSVPGLSSLPADAPVAVTGDYSVEIEKPLSPGDTDIEIDVGTIDKTKISSVVINADLVALTIYTNAADGSGGQTFDLAANKSVAWNSQIPGQVNPITANITKFYCNNAAAKAGIFRAAFLMNT